VFVVVGNQIVEGEAVMGGDEIDAGRRLAVVDLIQVGAAGEALGEFPEDTIGPAPIIAHAVAVFAVPFRPAGWELADLVAILADVPGLGDELYAGDNGVLVDDAEEGAEAVDVIELAGQGGGQVESEAVDVHFVHPIPKAVHDERQDVGQAGVEGIARPGIIIVIALIIGEPVIFAVIYATVGECRSELVAFGGVIVDDVEKDFDPRLVELFDHFLKFLYLATMFFAAVKLDVWSEEADGIVSPVIGQAFVHEVAVGKELMDGHQLDGRDAELFKIVDDLGMRECGIGAADVFGNSGEAFGEAFDMDFVDDSIIVSDERGFVVLPVERVVDDNRLGSGEGIIPCVAGKIVLADGITI